MHGLIFLAIGNLRESSLSVVFEILLFVILVHPILEIALSKIAERLSIKNLGVKDVSLFVERELARQTRIIHLHGLITGQ